MIIKILIKTSLIKHAGGHVCGVVSGYKQHGANATFADKIDGRVMRSANRLALAQTDNKQKVLHHLFMLTPCCIQFEADILVDSEHMVQRQHKKVAGALEKNHQTPAIHSACLAANLQDVESGTIQKLESGISVLRLHQCKDKCD